MESPLQHLIGQKLLCLSGGEGELMLELSAAKVAVFSPVSGGSFETCIGSTVQALRYTEHESWRIGFSNGQALLVSLRAKDFCGPEAFCVTFANGVIVVAP